MMMDDGKVENYAENQNTTMDTTETRFNNEMDAEHRITQHVAIGEYL